jgi:hypothetical protein
MGLLIPARSTNRLTIRSAQYRSMRPPSTPRKIGPIVRSPMYRSRPRPVGGAIGIVTCLPPLRTIAYVRCPRSVEQRERDRGTNAYEPWVPSGGSLLDAIIRFDEWVAETPRIGLWIDSSELTIEEAVDAILDHWEDAAIE